METKPTTQTTPKKRKPAKKVIKQEITLAPESTPYISYKPLSFFGKIKKFLGL
jgi:hypothetical protein